MTSRASRWNCHAFRNSPGAHSRATVQILTELQDRWHLETHNYQVNWTWGGKSIERVRSKAVGTASSADLNGSKSFRVSVSPLLHCTRKYLFCHSPEHEDFRGPAGMIFAYWKCLNRRNEINIVLISLQVVYKLYKVKCECKKSKLAVLCMTPSVVMVPPLLSEGFNYDAGVSGKRWGCNRFRYQTTRCYNPK